MLLQGADLESPTMFITHFTGTPYCNEFSLASDDPGVLPFNARFAEQYRLGRCKLTKVRRRDRLRHHCTRFSVWREQSAACDPANKTAPCCSCQPTKAFRCRWGPALRPLSLLPAHRHGTEPTSTQQI